MPTFSDCPQCGQRLRPQWVRCPRCRSLVPGGSAHEAVAAVEAATAAGSRANIYISGAALVAIALVVVMVMREAPTVPPSVNGSAAQVARPSEGATTTDDEPENAADAAASMPSTNFAAIDSKRSANVAYAQGDFARALAELEAAVAAAPADPEARNNLGQLLVRNGRAAESLPHFDEAVRLVTTRWEYRFNRARAYGLVNRWEDAVSEYRAAAQLFPEDYATQYNLGLALLRVRDYGAAVASLELAVQAAPEQHDFLITLGTAYVGAAQPERARATFERFLAAAPDNPEAPRVKQLLQALADAAP